MMSLTKLSGLPHEQAMQLYTYRTMSYNGYTTDRIVWKMGITNLELGMLLMGFDADELEKLQAQADRNEKRFIERLARNVRPSDEEIRRRKSCSNSVFRSAYPEVDRDALVGDTQTIAIQVNGKTRGTVEATTNALEQTIEQLAYQNDRVKPHIEGRQITRKVFVMGCVLNFVVQDKSEQPKGVN